LHQFSVAGKQPEPVKNKLNVLESTLDGTDRDGKIILVTSRLDAFASSFALAKGANSGKFLSDKKLFVCTKIFDFDKIFYF